jgi:mono/diheme cytochrome c family protein
MVERGKALYGVNCTFCHGADARGGSGGPSLIRSQVVLNDKSGELITPLVQKGVADKMPALPLSTEQVSDIAAFIHSFKVSGYDSSRQRPPSIVVGDAKAGEAYFNAKCGSCHSVTGDLQGIGARFRDPRAMQQYWLMPGSGRGGPGGGGAPASTLKPTTVTVTLPSGQTAEGRLVRIDDFLVILADADGVQRSFRRDGETPKVEVHDPLKPHKDLLPVYRDKDSHDVTAYLVTIK